jgi:predicted NBD/HSP70 family sugar kinase
MGSGSRGDIAYQTGLSAATVSRIADDLIQAQMLTVAGTVSTGSLGRRSELLRINPNGGRVLGIHFGGHSNDVGLADLSGDIYAETHLPLVGRQEFDEVFAAVAREATGLIEQDRRRMPLLGVGIATGGVIDSTRGFLVAQSQFQWRDIPLREAFENCLGRYVAVGNSFQGLAWYETLFSGLERRGSVLFVNCSTIIGAGFSTPNNITGTTSLSAGQLGHTRLDGSGAVCTCGGIGCLQAVASDPALVAKAEAILGPSDAEWDIYALGTLAAQGDSRAVELFEERARLLVPAIAVLANSLAPSWVALGHNRHAYADNEHAFMAELLEDALYPPLRGVVQVRPVREREPKRAVAAAVAVILRDVFSPTLDLVRGPRRRLVPELTLRAESLMPEEDRDPE